MMSRFKHLVLAGLFGRWRRPCPFEPGYTILLPSPMDMPFLLRYALEGLARLEIPNCRQILIVPDGWGKDRGAALRSVMAQFDDPRIEMVDLRPVDYLAIRSMRPPGSAATHWMMVVNGTTFARCEYAFLHDADAFFLEADGLERQFRECRDRGMSTLGVTARSDPFFQEVGYAIPGTWELMYSTRWARAQGPHRLRGQNWPTPRGSHAFDSMLYRQYMDYPQGTVGVMENPPRFVHYNGTIFTYRMFRDAGGRQVVDELFRVLLLALLEDLIPAADGTRIVPTVAELARGLEDPSASVVYSSEVAVREYPVFREMLDAMCNSPIFQGDRASRIADLVRPFDEHYAQRPPGEVKGSLVGHRMHGLG